MGDVYDCVISKREGGKEGKKQNLNLQQNTKIMTLWAKAGKIETFFRQK